MAFEVDTKLDTLSKAAQFDICGYSMTGTEIKSPHRFIYKAALPSGGCTSLFKVLLTNVCSNDCSYCVNQVGRDCPRATFKPEELASTFMSLYRKRMVQGIFLSSGVAGSALHTQEKLVDTIQILRQKHNFKGYVHLKLLPGADFGSVEAACKLASRVSVNMEAPTAHHLAKLSSRKNIFQGIIEPMQWVKKIVSNNELLVPSGQTTQFVVGAADETDSDLLHTIEALYREIGLRRAYFSAFHPISQSRLEEHRPTPPIRQHRLYQSDWLLRVYGFSPAELEMALSAEGNLSLKDDPKQTIAARQPWLFPLDINKASYEELLRVPGIGPVSARRIVDSRADHTINAMAQLKKMKVVTKRAAEYIWFQGMLEWDKQVALIPEADESLSPPPELAEVIR